MITGMQRKTQDDLRRLIDQIERLEGEKKEAGDAFARCSSRYGFADDPITRRESSAIARTIGSGSSSFVA